MRIKKDCNILKSIVSYHSIQQSGNIYRKLNKRNVNFVNQFVQWANHFVRLVGKSEYKFILIQLHELSACTVRRDVMDRRTHVSHVFAINPALCYWTKKRVWMTWCVQGELGQFTCLRGLAGRLGWKLTEWVDSLWVAKKPGSYFLNEL